MRHAGFSCLQRPLSLVDCMPYPGKCGAQSLHDSVLKSALQGFQNDIDDWAGYNDDTMDIQVAMVTAQQLPERVKEAGGITA